MLRVTGRYSVVFMVLGGLLGSPAAGEEQALPAQNVLPVAVNEVAPVNPAVLTVPTSLVAWVRKGIVSPEGLWP